MPGEYEVSITYSSDESWGKRIASLKAEHVEYKGRYLGWTKVSDDIGVDSGQCGIFSLEEYRNDEASKSFNLPLVFGNNYSTETGDDWYQRMCALTLLIKDGGVSDKQWGATLTGVVSSSGYGDGVYDLYVKHDEDKIIAFSIVYLNI
jgi:hypothetical protein